MYALSVSVCQSLCLPVSVCLSLSLSPTRPSTLSLFPDLARTHTQICLQKTAVLNNNKKVLGWGWGEVVSEMRLTFAIATHVQLIRHSLNKRTVSSSYLSPTELIGAVITQSSVS